MYNFQQRCMYRKWQLVPNFTAEQFPKSLQFWILVTFSNLLTQKLFLLIQYLALKAFSRKFKLKQSCLNHLPFVDFCLNFHRLEMHSPISFLLMSIYVYNTVLYICLLH